MQYLAIIVLVAASLALLAYVGTWAIARKP
jgi:hypothetical protein